MPPKPGRRLLNGVQQCRRRSAGGPLGADEAPEGPWGRRGVPRESEYQSCIDTGQSGDLPDDYMLRAALKGTHFFRRKLTCPKIDLFFGFIVTRQTAMPIQIVPRFCARGCGRFEKLLYGCQNPSR